MRNKSNANSAIKEAEKVNLVMDYELGKKAADREILSYIEHICFSHDDEIIKFRVDNGSRGVRDNIIEFIRSKYL